MDTSGAERKRKNKQYIVRQAFPSDVSKIVRLLYPGYFQESAFFKLVTPSEDRLVDTLFDQIYSQRSMGFVVEDPYGNIVGYAALGFDVTYYEEVEADVTIFFITKEYRGSGASRDLIETLLDRAKTAGAKIIYAACACGFDDGGKNDKLWINLYKKYGFQVLGTMMVGQI